MTTPDPRWRAGDTDRQATVDRLTEHFTAGRLTAAEYDERVRQAYASTYLDELPPLMADLPDESRPGGAGFAGRGDARGSAGWGGWAADDRAPGDGDGPFGLRGSGRRGGYRAADPGWGRRDGYRHRPPFAVLPVIVAVALLIAFSHGFVLIPLVWIGLAMLLIGRRRGRGGCGRRLGPRSAP